MSFIKMSIVCLLAVLLSKQIQWQKNHRTIYEAIFRWIIRMGIMIIHHFCLSSDSINFIVGVLLIPSDKLCPISWTYFQFSLLSFILCWYICFNFLLLLHWITKIFDFNCYWRSWSWWSCTICALKKWWSSPF